MPDREAAEDALREMYAVIDLLGPSQKPEGTETP